MLKIVKEFEKRTILIMLFLVTYSVMAIGQRDVVLNGRVLHPSLNEINLTLLKNITISNNQTFNILLDQNSEFTIRFTIQEPTQGYLAYGKTDVDLFLDLGDSLHLTFEGDKFIETLKYSGRGEKNQNYLAEEARKFESSSSLIKMTKEFTAEKYSYYIDSVLSRRHEFLLAKEKEYSLSAAFKIYREVEQRFLFAYLKCLYPEYNARLNGKNDKALVPSNYYNFLDELKIQDEDLPLTFYYLEFLFEYLNHQYDDVISRTRRGKQATYADLYWLAKMTYTGKILYSTLAKIMTYALSDSSEEELQTIYNDFMAFCPDAVIKAALKREYEVNKNLSSSKQAPGFTLLNENGKKIALKDFFGKVVYIDFWASWCGPCIREMPSSKKLRDKFSGKDVVFLYISLDRNLNDWKKAINKHEINGINIISRGFDSEVAQLYNIKSIPSYFIIDRSGNIFQNRPKKPSDDGISEQLENALAGKEN